MLVTTVVTGTTSTAQQSRINQASSRDSVVTIVDLTKACKAAAVPRFAPKSEVDTLPRIKALIEEFETEIRKTERGRVKEFCDLGRDMLTSNIGSIPTRATIKSLAQVATHIHGVDNAGGTDVVSLLGISETAIVGGIAQFLVDRARAELQLAFVDRVKDFTCETERVKVFATTCHTLRQADFVLRATFARELRSAIEKDLRAAPRTVPLTVIARKDFREQMVAQNASQEFRQKEDLILAAYYAGTVFADLLTGASPVVAMMKPLNSDREILAGDSQGLLHSALAVDAGRVTLPIAAILYRLSLVGTILPPNTNSQPEWPKSSEDQLYFTKALAINLCGWLPELGIDVAKRFGPIIAVAEGVRNQLNDTREAINAIKAKDKSVTLADYATIVDASLKIAEDWVAFVDRFHPLNTRIAASIGDLRTIATGLASRDYVSVAIGMYGVLDHAVGVKYSLPGGATRYLSFLTATVQAKDADEFAKTLDAFAAPVGSYREKRTGHDGYVVINGYLGGMWGGKVKGTELGFEKVSGIKSDVAGVFAPIGLETGFNYGGFSVSVFGQVLDLGAPASYRLKRTPADTTVQEEPEAGFRQVFSPGGAVLLGWKKLPISVGWGRNIAPQLRENATSGKKLNAVRSAWFLAVDIPIFVVR